MAPLENWLNVVGVSKPSGLILAILGYRIGMWQTESRFSERPHTVHEHLDSRCLGERSSIAYPEISFVRRNEFAVTGCLSIPSRTTLTDSSSSEGEVKRLLAALGYPPNGRGYFVAPNFLPHLQRYQQKTAANRFQKTHVA